MKTIYSKDYFDRFLKDLCDLKGRALSTRNLFKNYYKQVLEEGRNVYNGSIVVFFDQTKSESRLSSPPFDFIMNNDNVQEMVGEFVGVTDNLFFTKYWECLTTFLKDIITYQLLLNEDYLNKLGIESMEFDEVRKSLDQNSIKKKNGKHFYEILRETSPTFKEYDNNSDWVSSFSEHYQMFAVVRHIITHQNSLLKDGDKSKLGNFGSFVDKHFDIIEKDADKIILKEKHIGPLSTVFCEHAFVIYKAISIDNGEDWNHYQLKVE